MKVLDGMRLAVAMVLTSCSGTPGTASAPATTAAPAAAAPQAPGALQPLKGL
ncbi:MAG: hypothetical protein JWM80_2576, partial [Cyanobacteria bacterium RYN_339]|nr:hypothetical protein [Cyanobacteria bacterium RYN_339]